MLAGAGHKRQQSRLFGVDDMRHRLAMAFRMGEVANNLICVRRDADFRAIECQPCDKAADVEILAADRDRAHARAPIIRRYFAVSRAQMFASTARRTLALPISVRNPEDRKSTRLNSSH